MSIILIYFFDKFCGKFMRKQNVKNISYFVDFTHVYV